jgi:hypothetical protein
MYSKPMKLNDKLANHILISPATKNPDVFGLEIELEGSNIASAPINVCEIWSKHNDGSLRIRDVNKDQCIEYVLRQPLNFKDTEEAIHLLFNFLSGPKVEVYDSYRTSIHVHLNFCQEYYKTIYNFITLSLILDELLVSQNGEHRIGNNFCLRAKDAMGQVTSLIQLIECGENFMSFSPHDRYSSINLASLTKFGSIEFRSLECTLDRQRLFHWIGTLQHIKEKARIFSNPTEIIRQFSLFGPQEFLSTILGPFAYKYLLVENVDKMLNEGMRIAQDFAFCSAWKEQELPPSWEKRDQIKEPFQFDEIEF